MVLDHLIYMGWDPLCGPLNNPLLILKNNRGLSRWRWSPFLQCLIKHIQTLVQSGSHVLCVFHRCTCVCSFWRDQFSSFRRKQNHLHRLPDVYGNGGKCEQKVINTRWKIMVRAYNFFFSFYFFWSDASNSLLVSLAWVFTFVENFFKGKELD